MSTIAYLTNAVPESGVGLRATRIREQLARLPGLDLEEFRIDGTVGLVQRNQQHFLQERYVTGSWQPKTLRWLTLGIRLRHRLRREGRHQLWHATNQTLS